MAKMVWVSNINTVTGRTVVPMVRDEWAGFLLRNSSAYGEEVGCLDAPELMAAGSAKDVCGESVQISRVVRRGAR